MPSDAASVNARNFPRHGARTVVSPAEKSRTWSSYTVRSVGAASAAGRAAPSHPAGFVDGCRRSSTTLRAEFAVSPSE
jgi:hypothetical protein